MRLALVVSLVVARTAAADATVSEPPPGMKSCERRDGIYFAAAPGRAVPVREMHLYSTANDNQRYALTVIAPPRLHAQGFVLLCVGGERYASSIGELPGSRDGDGGVSFFDFTFARATADQVAAALVLRRRDRRPLGRGLVWSFRLVGNAHRVGEPIELAFTLTNRGTEAVQLTTGHSHPGPGPDNQYTFDIVSLDGGAPPDIPQTSVRGLGGEPVLQPGESSTQTIDLKHWAAFTRPGRYRVRCQYRLELAVPHELHSLAHAHERWDVVPDETIEIAIGP